MVDHAAGALEEGVVLDAAGREATRGKAGHGDSQETCSNCGTSLAGPYCSECGQLADTFHRPIWELAGEALGSFLSLDSRLSRTLPLLVLRPGVLTRAYLDGQRTRFVPPFRLFVFASVIFFILFSWAGPSPPFDDDTARADMGSQGATDSGGEEAGDETARDAVSEDAVAALAALEARREQRQLTRCALHEALLPEEPDPLCAAVRARIEARGDPVEEPTMDVELEDAPLGLRRFVAAKLGRAIEEPDTYFAAVLSWAPRVVIALFPIYALLLGLMHFWRRRIYLYHHLVVALNFHAFILVASMLVWLASLAIGWGWGAAVLLVWSNWGLYNLHRRTYGHGRIASVIRVVMLDMTYLFVLSFAIVALFALGFTSL